jgi:hypothetical protein
VGSYVACHASSIMRNLFAWGGLVQPDALQGPPAHREDEPLACCPGPIQAVLESAGL